MGPPNLAFILGLALLCGLVCLVVWLINTPAAKCRTRLAWAWKHLESNDRAEAEALFQEVVEQCREQHWRNHILANALLGLASLWRKEQRNDEAEPAAELALELASEHYGTDEPALMPYLLVSGLLALEGGRIQEAERLLGEAVRIWQERGAIDPMFIAPALNSLARLAMVRNAWAEAQQYLYMALQVHGALGDPDVAGRIETLVLIGQVSMELGDWEAAADALDAAFEGAEDFFGPEHPLTAEMLRDQARLLVRSGERQQAIAQLKQAQSIFEQQPDAAEVVRAGTPLLLGKLFWNEGDIQQSEFWYQRGFEQLYRATRQLEPDSPRWHALLAWHLATCPVDGLRDGREALDHALQAADLEPRPSWSTLAGWAAALAELEEYDAALEKLGEATAVVPDAHRGQLEDHRQSYLDRIPWRDTHLDEAPQEYDHPSPEGADL